VTGPTGDTAPTGDPGSAREARDPGPGGDTRPTAGSGLRNPAAAVRGVGAGALAMEAIVLLLAIVPLIKLAGHVTGFAIGAILALAVGCLVVAGLLRHRWAWYAGAGMQVALALCGVFHLALLALGVLFGAVWAYVLSVRRSVLGRI
jgi:hypothetical protein